MRAIFQDREAKNGFGKLVPVDLDILIDEVYVSPTSQAWFKDIVSDILLKYDIKKKVIESSMKDEPFY
ncbi:MAG: hypothetical protein EOO07_02270 [Chitinophagaceae bacterium]|nr:MAG: hypothetical protein EOO07_02270 [Chitinophagaceae bacterium]